MKMRKTIAGALALLATAIASSAAAINITVDSSGNYRPNGTVNAANGLATTAFYGSFQSPANGPSSQNNSETNNYNFLKGVVENWNGKPLTPTLPEPIDAKSAFRVEFSGAQGEASSYQTLGGYQYVVFHFGGGGNPRVTSNLSSTHWWSAWYLGGDQAVLKRPTILDNERLVGGFSTATYFNPTSTKVPDNGSTIIALGAGLLGLGGVRRFLIKA